MAITKWVYLHGPESIMWGGLTDEQVCARLTGVNEMHWHDHHTPCEAIIERKSMSLAVGAALALMVWGLVCVSTGIFVKYSIVKPICGATTAKLITPRALQEAD
jgi:hypothetical protein